MTSSAVGWLLGKQSQYIYSIIVNKKRSVCEGIFGKFTEFESTTLGKVNTFPLCIHFILLSFDADIFAC